MIPTSVSYYKINVEGREIYVINAIYRNKRYYAEVLIDDSGIKIIRSIPKRLPRGLKNWILDGFIYEIR